MATPKETEPQKQNFLNEFIQGIRELPEFIVSGAVSASRDKGDLDEESIVSSFGAALKETMVNTAGLLSDIAKKASKEDLQNVELMLRTMGSGTLVSEAKNMSKSLTIFGKKLGLQQIIQLIKKLIQWVFDIFNIKLPWLEKLIDLIDEIINAILGGGNAKATHAFSLREQDYLNELTALTNYETARARLRENDDGDDDY